MDIAIRNGTVVTMDDRRRVLKNFSLGIERGKIVRLEKEIREKADYEIDARGKVVMPGLVNTHTHLAMTLFRGAADDMPLDKWLSQEVWPVEGQLEPRHVYAGSLLGCLEMIRSGTTTFNDMYFHLDEVARSVRESGMRGVLSYPLLDIAGEEQGRELFRQAEEGMGKYNGLERDSNLKVFVGPHSPYTCSRELLLKARELADRHSTGIHIHVAETREEVEASLEKRGMGPFQYLDSIGFLGSNVLAVHSTHVSESEEEIMGRQGLSVSHNPVSNMKLAAGAAPVTRLLESGINVALGTDGCGSNNSLDMFEEMKTASLLQKVTTGDARALNFYQALEMATINGARALGIDSEVGSLEVGKRADVILVDFDKPHLKPLSNPLSHLVYSARGCDVSTTIVEGRVLMEGGKMRTLDQKGVMKFAQEEARALFAKAGKGERIEGR